MALRRIMRRARRAVVLSQAGRHRGGAGHLPAPVSGPPGMPGRHRKPAPVRGDSSWDRLAGLVTQMTGRLEVLDEVAAERRRQDELWGEQNHVNGTGPAWSHRTLNPNLLKALWDARIHTWAVILAEEVAEALDEIDDEPLREELIQVAAVAVAWVEAIDRKGSPA